MPWCGYWGTAGAGCWWLLPLIGLVLMGIMFLVCFRGVGCMGRRRRTSAEIAGLQHEVETLKEDVRKLLHQPS